MKYYCEYFAIYALLIRMGIKCEIHECTALLCGMLEKEDIIPNGYRNRIEKDRNLRIDNQYYLKNRETSFDYDEILDFVLRIKDIASSITYERITYIRRKISEC